MVNKLEQTFLEIYNKGDFEHVKLQVSKSCIIIDRL